MGRACKLVSRDESVAAPPPPPLSHINIFVSFQYFCLKEKGRNTLASYRRDLGHKPYKNTLEKWKTENGKVI
jgi:hypothetical protein